MPYGSILTDTVQSSTAATAPVFKDGNGTQIGTLCRAWVNFNGTGTVAIRASFNVSSITDNGAGDYTVNFTTALPDANYAPVISNSPPYGGTATNPVYLFTSQRGAGNWAESSPTTSSFRVAAQTATDNTYVTVSVFR